MKIYKYCEYCGRRFEALRRDRRFCSPACVESARKDRLRTVKMLGLNIPDMSQREVFSVELASVYLGISRATMYRWIYHGYVPSKTVEGRRIVRRCDLDIIFRDESPAEVKHDGRALVSVSEAARSYGYSFSQCYRILTTEGVPFVKFGRTDYYDRAEVDKVLTKRTVSGSFIIAGWYTIEQISEKYEITERSARTLVHDYGIPWKRFNRIRIYSAEHVDAARRTAQPSYEGYLSIKEAMERYNMTYNNVRRHAEKFGISKMTIGGRIFMSKSELEAAFASADFDL